MECLFLEHVFWSNLPYFYMSSIPAHPCGENEKVLGTDVSPDDALSVARFYEQQHELGKAGKFYRCVDLVLSTAPTFAASVRLLLPFRSAVLGYGITVPRCLDAPILPVDSTPVFTK